MCSATRRLICMPMLDYAGSGGTRRSSSATTCAQYGPDGVLSYTYDQVLQTMKQGRINYSSSNETFLVQMAGPTARSRRPARCR